MRSDISFLLLASQAA